MLPDTMRATICVPLRRHPLVRSDRAASLLRRLCAWSVASALWIGCTPPPPPEQGPHLLYSQDPASTDNPFPDVRLITADGLRLDQRPDWFVPFLMPKAVTGKLRGFLQTYTHASSGLHGANNFGPTLLRPSVALDPSALGGVAVRLVKRGEVWEILERDVAVEHSQSALFGTNLAVPAAYPEFIVVRPSVALPCGAEGMLVITRGLRTLDGAELQRGFAHEQEEGATERLAVAAPLLGLPEADVLLALPLRAMEVLPPMQRLAAFTGTAPPPAFAIAPHGLLEDGNGKLLDGVWTRADPDWASVDAALVQHAFNNPATDVGQVIAGTFKAKELREEGLWAQRWVDDPATAPEVDLRFILTLPIGPKPSGGWKIVVGGHGLNSRNTLKFGDSRSFCIEVAQILAKGGFGCLGIDAPSHGTRGDSLSFFAMEDLRKARDNFRQMAFDQMQLSSLASVLDVDGDGAADLAPGPGYFGNSLGAIMGANFMSLDPRVKVGVLNVPGGGLSNILSSESIRDQIGLLLSGQTGLPFGSAEYYSAFPLLRAVAQLFLEQGDPVNLGPGFRDWPDRALLLQEGVRDHTIPNFTTENLATSMGVPQVGSGMTGGLPLRVFTRIDPTKFGKPESYNGHNVFWDIEPSRTQVMDFLSSGGTTLTVD